MARTSGDVKQIKVADTKEASKFMKLHLPEEILNPLSKVQQRPPQLLASVHCK